MSSAIESGYGRTLYRARRYDEAIIHYQRATELDPQEFGAYGRLGEAYEELGRFDEAIRALQKAAALSGGDDYRVRLAHVFAKMGRRREALQILDDEKAAGAKRKAWVGVTYAALGDKDRAFQLLNEAMPERDLQLTWIKTDPKFDRLRSDPRFGKLVRRTGLSP